MKAAHSAPYYQDAAVTLHHGTASDANLFLATGSAQTIVTSPPYFGLRDYGHESQIGTETSLAAYVRRLVGVFSTLKDVLADDGTLWLNLGDSYSTKGGNLTAGVNGRDAGKTYANLRGRAGDQSDLPDKNMLGVPWHVAFGLQADGWILRSDIIWSKPNAMPESVTDRPTKSHEHLFMFAKSPRYFYDAPAIREVGANGKPRNRRDVWSINTSPFPGAHFAVYPPELIRPCILAGSRPGDTVLDPFSGSGTTGMVALEEDRKYVGIDVNRAYLDLSLSTRLCPEVRLHA